MFPLRYVAMLYLFLHLLVQADRLFLLPCFLGA